MTKTSAWALNSEEWIHQLELLGGSKNILGFWLDGLYKDPAVWKKHVSSNMLASLHEALDFSLPTISLVQEAQDGTVKFLIKFKDDLEVETVLIPFHRRKTICLSTQVGCGMNCSFCYTGTQGLKRHLTAGEIVGQYLVARDWLWKHEPKALSPSIVFMGQGEPLHNVDAVLSAAKVFTDKKLVGLGHRQLTLSTVGYLPAMEKLLEFPKINIALSLHSPFQKERSELIPINERFTLDEVLEALDRLPLLSRQFITFEYLLVKDFNMSEAHVEELHRLLGHRPAILNLIPFNPFPGSKWERPTVAEIDRFKEKLVEKRLRVMVRTTKGDDILAACGQLKVNKLARISK